MGDDDIMALLEIEHISKSFESDGRVYPVIEDLSLSAGRGEFVVILGKSGCGKTTLLRCAGGFAPPDSGRVLLDGREIRSPTPAISMVFQTFDQLFPWKTVLHNLTYPLHIARPGLSKKELQEMGERYLEMVNLSRFRSYYPHQLSGGMKQRVAIARSLSLGSDVILMDEPFASLDAQTRSVLQRTVLRLWAETGVTVLFVTHNIEEAIILGSRLIMMGSQPSGIILDMKNPVEAKRGEVRTPKDAGFGDCWELLNGKLEIGNEEET
jgi:NitT/TauT family transport system ATP-binding protein